MFVAEIIHPFHRNNSFSELSFMLLLHFLDDLNSVFAFQVLVVDHFMMCRAYKQKIRYVSQFIFA